RRDLRRSHDRQKQSLQTQDDHKRCAADERVELISSKENAERQHEDDHARGHRGLTPESRADVLDQDRVVQPVAEAVHHESSFAPTLRKRCSRFSLRGANEATRTPPRTSVARRSLACSTSPWKRNSKDRPRCWMALARGSPVTIWRSASALSSPRTSTRSTVSPRIRALISSILPATTTRPRSMIATDVQNSDISVKMCEEISTVRPSAARSRRMFLRSIRPWGSTPLAGSSRRRI